MLRQSVNQAHAPIVKLPNLSKFKPTTTFGRGKESRPFARDQRIHNESEFVHQSRIDEARGRSGAPNDATSANNGLPNRVMTAFEVAEYVGCHEETVRRAYWRGLPVTQKFGVRRRFHPADVLDWMRRGAPTKVS